MKRLVLIIIFTGVLARIQTMSKRDKLKGEEAKRIIDNNIIHAFGKGNFFHGIKEGLIEIDKEIE